MNKKSKDNFLRELSEFELERKKDFQKINASISRQSIESFNTIMLMKRRWNKRMKEIVDKYESK